MLLKKGFNSGIKLDTDVFNHDGATGLDASLQVLKVTIITELEDFNSRLSLLVHGLDPLVGLALRIDVERPSTCRVRDDGVLNRE